MGRSQTAGIAVARGIRVNPHLETSRPGICACGDCVESVDACTGEEAMFGLNHNALEQARLVARNLAGGRAAYPGAWTFARVHLFDSHAAAFGKTTRANRQAIPRPGASRPWTTRKIGELIGPAA